MCIPGRSSKCKGPEVGTGLACLRYKRRLVWLKYNEQEKGKKRHDERSVEGVSSKIT